MENTIEHIKKMVVPIEVSQEFKVRLYERLRDDLSYDLYKILEQTKNPAVVELGELQVKEKYEEVFDYYPRFEEISLSVFITPVQYHHMTFSKIDNIDFGYPITFFGTSKKSKIRKIWDVLMGRL